MKKRYVIYKGGKYRIGDNKINEIFITDKNKVYKKGIKSILGGDNFDNLIDIDDDGGMEIRHIPFKYQGKDYYATDFWPLPLSSGVSNRFFCKKCGYKEKRLVAVISSVVDWEYRKPMNHDELIFTINHSGEGRKILTLLSKDDVCEICKKDL